MTRTPVTLGHHWIVDLHGCPIELLDDHDLMCQRLKETTERFGLTLLDIVSNRFEPQGVTVVGLLAESHMSIHTWPEHNYAAIDIFTCGDPQIARRIQTEITERFSPATANAREFSRGPIVNPKGSI